MHYRLHLGPKVNEMQIIRFILGRIILFLDWLTSPRPNKISRTELDAIQNKVKNMTIYEFRACPFCVRVRRFMKKNNIIINTKDARRSKVFAQELIDGGGKLQVPCLKIGDSNNSEWLYESKDIILYLKKHLGITDE